MGLDDTITYGAGMVILFHGIPGTGKTMMANALANKLNKKVHSFQYGGRYTASNMEEFRYTTSNMEEFKYTASNMEEGTQLPIWRNLGTQLPIWRNLSTQLPIWRKVHSFQYGGI